MILREAWVEISKIRDLETPMLLIKYPALWLNQTSKHGSLGNYGPLEKLSIVKQNLPAGTKRNVQTTVVRQQRVEWNGYCSVLGPRLPCIRTQTLRSTACNA